MKSIDNMPFSLNALQAFVVVCECSSMSDAARRLGVTQSAVSQLVKSLEDQIGALLLDRDFRPARPTAAGRMLLELSNDLLEHVRHIAARIRDTDRAGQAIIRLGCVDSFAATVGPTLIRALSGTSRKITLWSGLTPVLSEQLHSREVDMAIVTETPVDDPRISQHRLLSEAFVAVVPKGWKAASESALRELGKLELIRYTRRSVIGQQVDRYICHIGLESARRFEFDATDPMLSLVASGLGYAITTPLCLWQSRQYLDQVEIVPLPDSDLGRRHFFLMVRDSEWTTLTDEVIGITRQALLRQTIPDVRKYLPTLPDDAIRVT